MLLTKLFVTRRPGGLPHQGRLVAGNTLFPCALGRNGITYDKREGDGATPAGDFRLISFYLRHACILHAPWRLTHPRDAWCDDESSFRYNRALTLPTQLSHEEMWRLDNLYDVVGVMDYNLKPVRRSRGSAIFFHIATSQLEATAGCVALRREDMRKLLPRLARGVCIYVR